jgi:hypothetical protein
MTRDEALDNAISACTELMQLCAETDDFATGEAAFQARRHLTSRKYDLKAEAVRAKTKKCLPR